MSTKFGREPVLYYNYPHKKAKIIYGSIVGCNEELIEWKDSEIIFDAISSCKNDNMCRLTAAGYGNLLENEGLGAVFASKKDLIFI